MGEGVETGTRVDARVSEQLAAVDLLRRRVLNVVGHELRTPITTLRGLAESLGSSDDPEAELTLHDAIRRTARRTEALLDDLLLATGVSTALPVAAPERVPVAATTRLVWSEVGDGAEIAIDGDDEVLTAPGVLERILSALLDNAARYGEPPVQVTVRRRDGAVSIVVADQGPGVPSAELALLTEPFFRGERAVLTHHSLGLGLAVVRSLVGHVEGDVEPRNRDGGGFEIEVVLPG